ncbi:TetR family transcriptional regulator [Myxococcota bacterium]|nr:TetR family transcriptional regulator [Myxococcota bacterium]
MPRTRARDAESKEARRAALLNAASTLFETQSFGQVTMGEICAAAGLAKGTAYLYFTTKEALFLELLARELEAWFGVLAEAPLRPGKDAPDVVAALFADSLAERPALVRLLGLLHLTLEQNVSAELVLPFKQRLAERMAEVGARIEAVLPQLSPGDGVRLFLRAHALVVGLGQMSQVKPELDALLLQPELCHLKVEWAPELRACLAAMLRGW